MQSHITGWEQTSPSLSNSNDSQQNEATEASPTTNTQNNGTNTGQEQTPPSFSNSNDSQQDDATEASPSLTPTTYNPNDGNKREVETAVCIHDEKTSSEEASKDKTRDKLCPLPKTRMLLSWFLWKSASS